MQLLNEFSPGESGDDIFSTTIRSTKGGPATAHAIRSAYPLDSIISRKAYLVEGYLSRTSGIASPGRRCHYALSLCTIIDRATLSFCTTIACHWLPLAATGCHLGVYTLILRATAVSLCRNESAARGKASHGSGARRGW
jgi:hypothetical protein